MAELTLKERLQPSLLDRLTDEHPESNRESRDQRVWTLARFREMVLRDLSWLLNCESLSSIVDLEGHPYAAASVLNYGIPVLAGTIFTSKRTSQLEREIREAVRLFEPRILPDSLSVKAATSEYGSPKALTIEIRGELWARPLPQPLFLKTEVDLESGFIAISELPT